MENKEAAKKFRECWLLSTDSEVGGYQKYWISLLGDVLGEKDVLSRISFQLPVPMAGTTKFLDAWIPETKVLIEHKKRGVKLDAPQSGHNGMTPYEQAVEYDRAVLAAYGLAPDTPEPEIVSRLMRRYQEMTAK